MRRSKIRRSPAKASYGYWDNLALQERLQQNAPEFIPPSTDAPETFTHHTASSLASLSALPAGSRMLARDFIHNSLYHPSYGYFTTRADVFTLKTPFDFQAIRDSNQFFSKVADEYRIIDDLQLNKTDVDVQVWHTPTELFRPWYGYALANHIIKTFKNDKPDEKLIIYEVGAGNGTLMVNILDFILQHEPEIYKSMTYTVIEISPKLAGIQRTKMNTSIHRSCIKIINKSIFDYGKIRLMEDEKEPNTCFFVAMEVLDNLSHDVIRYDTITNEPYQALVLIDKTTDFAEGYETVTDPLISRFASLRAKTGFISPLLELSWSNWLNSKSPFRTSLSKAEFIPTMSLQLIEVLATKFPHHHALISDFSYLPDSVDGVSAPVVQTRYEETMVPCSTYLVQPGYFDIFFPTDFELLLELYQNVCGRKGSVITHSDFVQENGDVAKTTTKSGENVMKEYYQNVKFFIS